MPFTLAALSDAPQESQNLLWLGLIIWFLVALALLLAILMEKR